MIFTELPNSWFCLNFEGTLCITCHCGLGLGVHRETKQQEFKAVPWRKQKLECVSQHCICMLASVYVGTMCRVHDGWMRLCE